ncbi:N-acetylmuramate alpha-1-phosphate uridylyltransferase MurU [Shewanella maritima]|uniref:N-acetylmuramate alpha-1-phosphate uridylyltransferase MurU n=1 Tax=Shewanella maritima TaxID=2520507 RepID=UPI003735EAFB
MKAMILAAGRGERLRPLTDVVPKPLVEVAGKPLIEYHLEKLAKAGFKQVVINCAWLGHKLPERLGDGSRWGLSIAYSHEQQALETAGGIIQALKLLGDEPFFVINGDIFIEQLPNIKQLHASMMQQNAQIALWLVNNPVHNPSGDFFLNQQPDRDGDTWVDELEQEQLGVTYSGMGLYHPKIFTDLVPGRRALSPVIRDKIQQQQVLGQVYTHYWCDVGTIERMNTLEQDIVQGKVNTN